MIKYGIVEQYKRWACRSCTSTLRAAYYRQNRDAILVRRAKERLVWPERAMLQQCRHRARKRGMKCTLTIKDIVIPKRCPVLGIPIRQSGGGRTDNTPSVDRIDQRLGYTPNNIAVISWRANWLKCSATADELERLARYVRNHKRRRKYGA